MIVTIHDALPGHGKTTRMIKQIKQSQGERYLYIAPILTECHRIAGTVFETETDDKGKIVLIPPKGHKDFPYKSEVSDYHCAEMEFIHPTSGYNGCNIIEEPGVFALERARSTKRDSIRYLLSEGHNIVSTHELFKAFNQEIIQILASQDYTLVIDEALDVCQVYTKIKDTDWRMLFASGTVYIDPDGETLRWRDGADYKDGKFLEFRHLCDNGNLIRDSSGKVTLWLFPLDILKHFKAVYILTYRFESSPMAAYLRLKGVNYQVERIAPDMEKLKDLITIETNEDLNRVGGPRHALSKTKQEKWRYGKRNLAPADPTPTRLKNNMVNWFKHRTETVSAQNMWSCFKDAKLVLKGDGYSRGFVACNARATNDYAEKTALAYCVDINYHPFVERYLAASDEDQDNYALSTMIQWIFRSAIRNGKPIKVYIPSERMRRLFSEWLDGKR